MFAVTATAVLSRFHRLFPDIRSTMSTGPTAVATSIAPPRIISTCSATSIPFAEDGEQGRRHDDHREIEGPRQQHQPGRGSGEHLSQPAPISLGGRQQLAELGTHDLSDRYPYELADRQVARSSRIDARLGRRAERTEKQGVQPELTAVAKTPASPRGAVKRQNSMKVWRAPRACSGPSR